jgi:ABC-type phosphate transport system substrate-binding protein
MFWLGLAQASVARNDDFKVIVNPSNPLSVVDRGFLRDAFLKKATNWPDGKAVRPIDLSETQIREHFIIQVLKKTPAQLRSYWTQRIFTGLGVPPPEADTAQEAIRYVLTNRGAVAYLPINVDPGAAKVVTIER